MAEVVFITHRIPYPPDKGDKIRSYHILEHLAARHAVHLGTFVDAAEDLRYLDALHSMCASVCAIRLHPSLARIGSLAAFATGESLTERHYRSRRLRQWLRNVTATRPIAAVVGYSSGVGPYLRQRLPGTPRRIMDFVDVDSEKWRQYSQGAAWPQRAIYAREQRRLAVLERRLVRDCDASLFVSDAEAAFFAGQVPEFHAKVIGISNGVDCGFFDPGKVPESPYPAGPTIVFTGMMDYRANVDGVTWFADEVFARVRAALPATRLYIVGARPARQVRALAERAGIHVTGRVPDVRPYIAHASVAIAPLKIARGIQNKVLEALAMNTPVVGTPQAFEGIDAFPGRSPCTAAGPDAFAQAVLRILHRPRSADSRLREFVLERYDWDRRLAALDGLVMGTAETPDAAFAVRA